jgi:hypothetical protein
MVISELFAEIAELRTEVGSLWDTLRLEKHMGLEHRLMAEDTMAVVVQQEHNFLLSNFGCNSQCWKIPVAELLLNFHNCKKQTQAMVPNISHRSGKNHGTIVFCHNHLNPKMRNGNHEMIESNANRVKHQDLVGDNQIVLCFEGQARELHSKLSREVGQAKELEVEEVQNNQGKHLAKVDFLDHNSFDDLSPAHL